jgi:hypothetical protein
MLATPFCPSNKEDINEILSKIKNTGLDFNIEDGIAGFLWVLITPHTDGMVVKLTQTPGLIACIITALGLDGASLNKTPAKYGALGKDPDGMGCQEAFNYANMLGMMGCLIHKWLAILFAVNQYGKYSSKTKHVHEVTLKQIWR